MANTGLSVNDVVAVQIQLSLQAAQQRNFGLPLIMGDSDIINTFERLRLYSGSAEVAADFGTNSPEYSGAVDFFAQSPQPAQAYVGRWASTATHGLLFGAVIPGSSQAALLTVNTGAFNVMIDGVNHVLNNLDFTAQSNLNGVAAVIQTALSNAGSVRWDANNGRFLLESATTGSLSSVGFATIPSSGTDISIMLGFNNQQGGYGVPGIAAESATSAVATLMNQSVDWYGLAFASTIQPTDLDYVSIATLIESASPSRIQGITTQEPAVLNAATSTDLPSLLKAGGYNRTFSLYSSQDGVSACSVLGRAFSVDFNGQNTTITLAYKQLPGVGPELVTEAQKQAILGKNCNAFLKFVNGTAILLNGNMASGQWFDAIHGTDWFQNALQTAIYNVLYTTTTKIAQTDAGVGKLVVAMVQVCEQAVTNGLIAPGIWQGPDVGSIVTGQTLSKGYYIFAPKVSTQTQADRAARKSPVIQCAVKLAGAIHQVSAIVNVDQ